MSIIRRKKSRLCPVIRELDCDKIPVYRNLETGELYYNNEYWREDYMIFSTEKQYERFLELNGG
ncbi:MAG: hypothetical protein BV456_04610 [Thermoplasmata archaeon M8B2D]|nr:MAG: hypothetical protein BV456_04610 [Thermoplasmata archaeon M8B2D]